MPISLHKLQRNLVRVRSFAGLLKLLKESPMLDVTVQHRGCGSYLVTVGTEDLNLFLEVGLNSRTVNITLRSKDNTKGGNYYYVLSETKYMTRIHGSGIPKLREYLDNFNS